MGEEKNAFNVLRASLRSIGRD